MESSSNSATSRSTSLFLPINHISEELDVNELLSYWDPGSSPGAEAREPTMHHNLDDTHSTWPSPNSHPLSPNPLPNSQTLQFSPPPVPSNLPSNHPTYNHFSPNFGSDHGVISPLPLAFSTRRDWLSSLPQSSSSSSLSALVPPKCIPSSSSSPSFAHSVTASSHSQFTYEKPALRPSSSTNSLQSYKTMPWSSQLRDVSCINPGSSHDDDSPRGSKGGANAYSAVLRLSDVIAAMQPKSSNSVEAQKKTSHSSSADASLSSPNLALNSNSNSPSNSTIPQVKRTINPASIQSCRVNTSTRAFLNASKLLRGSPFNTQLASPMQRESKQIRKSESVSSLTKVGVLSEGKENTLRKAQDLGAMGEPGTNKRNVHIYNERERRRGMTCLYTTLHSLLPNGKMIKADRCSVLTETMEYIQSLLEELDELGKQKEEVLASLQAGKEVGKNEPDASTSTESTETGSRIHDAEAGRANASTHKRVKGQGNGSTRAPLQWSSEEYCNSNEENRKVDMCENEKEVTGSPESRGEVMVRLFGEDAFITVHTLKKRGAWSGVLEVLQQLNIHILNVTLSASLESNHHCIHGRVATGCKLNSYVLKRSLKAFVGEVEKSSPRGVSEGSLY